MGTEPAISLEQIKYKVSKWRGLLLPISLCDNNGRIDYLIDSHEKGNMLSVRSGVIASMCDNPAGNPTQIALTGVC